MNQSNSMLSKYAMTKPDKAKPKHPDCAGKFRFCSAESEMVEKEIGGSVYTYCKRCLSELEADFKLQIKRPRQSVQYSSLHTEAEKSFTKPKKGRKGL